MAKANKQAEAANKKKSAEQKDAAIQRAVELYKTLANSSSKRPPGYRAVCKMVEDELERETGVKIVLCYNTVCARSNGMLRNTLEMTEYSILIQRCPFPHSIQSGEGMVTPRRREGYA